MSQRSAATNKVNLERMTWREAEAAFAKKPVVLVPMGSIEEHGPQTPVGDYRYMTEFSTRVAEQTGAVVLPTIPWGYSEYFRAFPGTLTVRPQTLTLVLEDMVDCLIPFGIDHIMFVCGHKGNLPILEHLARDIRRKHGLRVATIEPLGWLTPDVLTEMYGTPNPQVGHGSDPMQSLAMHLFPEDVRTDLAEPGTSASWRGFTIKGTAAIVNGQPLHLYPMMDEVTEANGGNGVLGDPNLASAERGRILFERFVAIGVEMVRTFANIDTRC